MKEASADRGMMKWMPYQSLIEQSSILGGLLHEKGKRPKPLISSDQAEQINEILIHYHGEIVQATYWINGYSFEERGPIDRIDAKQRFLCIHQKRIRFQSLYRLDVL